MADAGTLPHQTFRELRRRAELLIPATDILPEHLSPTEAARVIYELRVHQIELEMQNEALRQAQQQLNASRDTYADLYDFAPVGYLTLDGSHRIVAANLTAASLLGQERSRLLNRFFPSFLEAADQAVFRQMLSTVPAQPAHQAKFRLRDRLGNLRVVLLDVLFYPDQEGKEGLRLSLTDITDLYRAEAESRRSEERLLLATAAAQLGVFEWDAASDQVYWENARMYEIFGCTPEEDPGSRDAFFSEFLEPHDRPALAHTLAQARRDEQAVQAVCRIHRRNDGALRWLEVSGRFYQPPDAAAPRLVGIVADITARKLREDLNRAQAVSRTGSWRLTMPRSILTWSDEIYRIVEIPVGTPLRHEIFLNAVHPEDRDDVNRQWQAALRGEPIDFEHRLLVNNTVKWVKQRAELEFDPQGRLLGGFGTTQDITDRRQAEEALRESEQQYRLLVKNIPAVVFRGYADYSIDFFDDKIEELIGYAREIFNSRQMNWQEVILPEDVDSAAQTFRQALKNSGVYVREYRVRHRDGRIIWVHSRGQIVRDAQGDIDYISGVLFDITPQKEMAQALDAEKERLRITLKSIGEGVIATDTAGRVVLMNQVAKKLSGWTQAQALGQPAALILDLRSETERSRLADPAEQVIHTGEPVRLANGMILISRDRNECLLALSGAPIVDRDGQVIGVVLVFRDVTQERQTEKELLKMEKLSSLGILAGGLAHDFNNILAGILGNVSLAGLCLEEPDKLLECLEGAEKAIFRATDLVQQLLTFAKGGTPVKELAPLVEIIRESAAFACCGASSQPSYSLPLDLYPLEIDPGQISQVFQNLVINGLQAMPAGGRLEIRAENLMVEAQDSLPLKPGKYINISVSDAGVGIPPENLEKIFDPYFTTKPKGSGLGLAVVYSIVRHHKGHVGVVSSLGVGSTFSVYLPAVEPLLLAAEPRTASYSIPAPELTRGRGRILVMDDEDMILELTGKLLAQLGYDAAFARNGDEALELYSQALGSGQPFDAVILDLTVRGGLGGRKTMARLLELDPQARGIVASGYSDDRAMTHFREFGFQAVIRKPCPVDKFAQTLHEVLHGQNST